MSIRVVAVDDHPMVLEYIQNRLQSEPDIELVGTETLGKRILPLCFCQAKNGSPANFVKGNGT